MESRQPTLEMLEKSFPEIPRQKIARMLERFEGRSSRLMDLLRQDTETIQQLILQYKIDPLQIREFLENFHYLRFEDVVSKIGEVKGDLKQARAALENKPRSKLAN